MKFVPERAVFVTFLPLALALAALGVREATRAPARVHVQSVGASAYEPPVLFLAASAAPARNQSLRVDGAKSTARVTDPRGETSHVRALRAAGNLRILADDSLADVELDLAPLAGTAADGWPRDVNLHLRGVGARSRGTAAPGVRISDLRCSAVLGGVAREVDLVVTWMRLPGGTVAMHAVAELDSRPFGLREPWPGRMLHRSARALLGLDLVLRADA